jgi:NTP pyrophosphatase (non-canonical NTP hydrolase)
MPDDKIDICVVPFDAFVDMLVKDPTVLLAEKTPLKIDLDHMAIGVAGEAGELVDAIKRFTIYNRNLDETIKLRDEPGTIRENIKEEIGDLLFYMQRICNQLGFTLADAENYCKQKLEKRYRGLEYSDQSAKDRADKQAY